MVGDELIASGVVETYPVYRCARCGNDHPAVQFSPLTNASDEWSFWGVCPELKEPILLCKEEDVCSPG